MQRLDQPVDARAAEPLTRGEHGRNRLLHGVGGMLILRPAQPADAIEVARVHVRSWQRGCRGLLLDAYLDGLRAADRAARYTFGRSGDSPATIVALEEGAIQGFATIGAAAGEADGRLGELLAL